MGKTGIPKTCQKSKFLRKKIWRNALDLKSKKVQGIFGKHFGIISLSCLSSTKQCLRFLLICFNLGDKKTFIRVPLELSRKAPSLVLHLSCYTLMTFLAMLYVILLSMLMILLSILTHLIYGNNLNLWTTWKSDLWVCLTYLVALVLLM